MAILSHQQVRKGFWPDPQFECPARESASGVQHPQVSVMDFPDLRNGESSSEPAVPQWRRAWTCVCSGRLAEVRRVQSSPAGAAKKKKKKKKKKCLDTKWTVI